MVSLSRPNVVKFHSVCDSKSHGILLEAQLIPLVVNPFSDAFNGTWNPDDIIATKNIMSSIEDH